jgi:uncharacterized protein
LKISVAVKTRAKKEGVELGADQIYTVRVNVPPVDGAANERVIELLSEFLGKPKSKIFLKSGHQSKKKIFEIAD